MKGILLLSHGTLGMGILDAADMIGLDTAHVEAVPLRIDSSLEEYAKLLEEAVERLDCGEGVLVMVDILSGTPFNQICPMLKEKNIEVITGMNLPMFISAVGSRDSKTLGELGESIIEDSRAGMIRVRDFL